MEVVSNCPLRVASLLWQPRPNLWALTLVCKATYRLVPSVCELAAEQEDLNEEDNYWNDDPSRSLYAPSDLVPFKVGAEVMLVGHAFAPRGQPTRNLSPRLIVGAIDKTLELWCDRAWTLDGQLREGPRFARMPLRYERAAGHETQNPVGVRPDVADAYGAVSVPNLQPPGLHISRRGDVVPPIGFGPIAPTWPSRLERLHQHASAFLQGRGLLNQPMPEGIDLRFFNAAPVDQQLDELHANERIVLEHLHPQHPRLVTSLPGAAPRAALERPGGGTDEVRLAFDTLWFDTDRSICTAVWRGQVSLEHPAQPGRIVVSLSGPGARSSVRPTPPASHPPAGDEGTKMDMESTYEPNLEEQEPVGAALPFVKGRSSSGLAAPAASPPRPGNAPPRPAPSRPGPPPGSPWPQGSVPSSTPPPRVQGTGTVAPPLMIPAASSHSPMSASMSPMPAMSASRPSMPTPMPASMSSMPAALPAPASAPPRTIGEAAMGGVVSASNAAAALDRSLAPPVDAGPRPVTSSARPGGREAFSLLWLDAEEAQSILAWPRWAPVLSQVDPAPPEPPPSADEDEDEEPYDPGDDDDDEPEEVKQRRLVQKILARGEPTDALGVDEAMLEAVRQDGTLEPPLVLVAGDLSFPFDPWETLQATLAVAAPAAAADKRLKEILDGIAEVMKTPGVQRAPTVAESLTARAREALQPGRGPAPVDPQVERMLLDQRAYQKRTLLGQVWIRSLLHASGVSDPIPTYLPESLAKQLPLAPRMRARVIAEVHPQQDQYEPHPSALRALALARVVSLGRR